MIARPTIAVIVPCFNEEAGIELFHDRLVGAMLPLGLRWTVTYVNDGSSDRTLLRLEELQERDVRVALINLSRNFGKEIALTAGLDHASADAVIVIDADLQDPPELIPSLIVEWTTGYDIVFAQRRTREGETWLKRKTADGFYRLMQHLGARGVRLPSDTGDFRLLSARALAALLQMREQHRFMKGLFTWIGFPSKGVPYDRSRRASGSSSWNYWQLWNFAVEGITSYTVMPLKAATYLGLMVAMLAALYGGVLIIRTMLFGNPVPGYPSLMAVILFLGGAQLVTLGVMGEYLGRVFNETKQRPLYWVEAYRPSRVTLHDAGAVTWPIDDPDVA